MNMASTRILIFAVTLAACGPASAQTDQADQSAPRNNAIVNKCIGADGHVVFSDKPCPDTHKAQQVDTSDALRTGSGGHHDEIAASVADSDCRRQARQSVYGPIDAEIEESNHYIADLQNRRSDIASHKIYASDGSGSLIDDPGALRVVADLDAEIAHEHDFQQQAHADAEAAYQEAVKACGNATGQAGQK
jgi:hypothetical protein